MKKCIPILIALLLLSAAPALAAEVTITADILSSYVWKGQIGDDNPVFQPDVYIAGPYGLAFDIWANMALTDNKDAAWDPDTGGKWNEVDIDLSWTVPWEEDFPVSATIGATYYIFPQAVDEAEEDEEHKAVADGDYATYVQITGNCILAPYARYTHYLGGVDDWRLDVGIGHEFDLFQDIPLSLGLGAEIGFGGKDWMNSQYGDGIGSAFNHVQLSAALTYALTDALSVSLKGFYSCLLDGDVRDAVDDEDLFKDTDHFWGGVSASYTF